MRTRNQKSAERANEHDSVKWQLFATFFKIGAFTFGGGYAMIPLIQKEMVERKKWITEKEIMDVVAIAETTPGPIAVNAATFVGYKVAGVTGAGIATFGLVLPPFVIIFLIATILRPFMDYPIVEHAFWGVRIAVLALITKTFFMMTKQCPKHILSWLVAIGAFVAVAICHVNVVFVVLAAAVVGMIGQSGKDIGK